MSMQWQWSTFDQLSRDEFFEIVKARQSIFIVEQNCAYQDVDELDSASWHLMGWCQGSSGVELAAYLRVSYPGKKYPEPSIGRVLTSFSARGKGLGKLLIREAIARVSIEYPGLRIRISAQRYLETFYSEFGFFVVSEPYDEEGIPHIEMLREAA